jgi:release factor glutamine methyltransferase
MPIANDWTILKLIRWADSYFKSHDIDSPRATAEILLAHCLKIKKIDLYLRYDQPLSSDELANFKVLIKRRLQREPVAYIAGCREFWSLDFKVSKDVLIPRPDTECLVETALKVLSQDNGLESHFLSEPKRIFEPGTGSGAVIVALATELMSGLSDKGSTCLFFASDLSPKAVDIARANARLHNLEEKIHFFSGNWVFPVKKGPPLFDLIISNPPYIPTQTIAELQPEIHKHEPNMALDGGKDGLESIGHIIRCAHLYLKEKGRLLLEIGHDQKERVQGIADEGGFYKDVGFTKDYGGHFRVVQMVKR